MVSAPSHYAAMMIQFINTDNNKKLIFLKNVFSFLILMVNSLIPSNVSLASRSEPPSRLRCSTSHHSFHFGLEVQLHLCHQRSGSCYIEMLHKWTEIFRTHAVLQVLHKVKFPPDEEK